MLGITTVNRVYNFARFIKNLNDLIYIIYHVSSSGTRTAMFLVDSPCSLFEIFLPCLGRLLVSYVLISFRVNHDRQLHFNHRLFLRTQLKSHKIVLVFNYIPSESISASVCTSHKTQSVSRVHKPITSTYAGRQVKCLPFLSVVNQT